MITLYEHPLSPYAQKVKIALAEKGLDFQLQMPGGLGAGGAQGEFVEASPRAEVPALVDGDLRIFDSTIILEYLEDAYPDPPLLPAAPAERARVRMLEEVMDTHFEAINWGISEIRWFRRAEGEKAEAMFATAKAQTEGFYAWLEKQLGDRQWFNGSGFGWGDLSVVPYLNGSVGQGNPPLEGSKLAAWLARANARPSVAACVASIAAMNANGATMPNVAELVEKGLFKREYRDHRLEWMIKSGGVDVVLKGLERNNIRFSPGLRVSPDIVEREDAGLGALLEERLYEFNRAATGVDGRELAYAIEEDGETVAGLAGYTWGGMAEVKQLWVREDHRHAGLGSALMHRAIDEARTRGCHLLFLTTHSFQAPAFYAGLGFEEIAVIADKPPGHAEHVLRLEL